MTQTTSLRADIPSPMIKVEEGGNPPVKSIKPDAVEALGFQLDKLFRQYVADRRVADLRWLRNQRQYLGLYDPEIEKELSPSRSKAYPKITRVKCISVLSRLMNLMFPGNERNWELRASPDPEMSPDDVMLAVQEAQKRDQEAGVQVELDEEYIDAAVQVFADKRADKLVRLIDDQLQELGGDQTYDYIALNREVIQSGVQYGLGLLCGPYVRNVDNTSWSVVSDPLTGMQTVQSQTRTTFKPQFEFLPVWDFYPDMSAKTFSQMDGYFVRKVISRSQLRKLADRADFFGDQIKKYIQKNKTGNYKPQPFETELRAMGVKVNTSDQKPETMKYEVIVWHGPVDGDTLVSCGVDVPESKTSDEIDAEIWMIDGIVIKASMNPWKKIGADVKTLHAFIFDKDDTSPIGQGLPNVIRDSQMSIAAMTRMYLDNASAVCGPITEMNTELLRADQDLGSIHAYKVFYRDDDGPTVNYPAIRPVAVDAHLNDLMQGIELFLKFVDMETFVGPATGGDMDRGPSEPFRTAAGASMLRGEAALPFKDIVRSFDQFTQSVIESIVQFNRKFNPDKTPSGDFNVIARGATSLIAKEIRGAQMDQLAATLRPEELQHLDERKFLEARFKARDLGDMLVTVDEAERRKAAQSQQIQEQAEQQRQLTEANLRKLLSDAYKNIAQGQKNIAGADAAAVSSALELLEKGLNGGETGEEEGAGGAGEEHQQPEADDGGGAGE